MNSSNDPPGGPNPGFSEELTGASIARWADSSAGLPPGECARRGIEAVAGLLISGDIFGTNRFPDAHFCACADIHHEVAGAGPNFDDHMVVNFRAVDIRDGIFPLVGEDSVRMVMQPLSDGRVSARWNAIDGTSESIVPGLGPMAEGLDPLSGYCLPLELGPIEEQEEEGEGVPSFLFLKDPGAGWQIWRRFMREGGDSNRAGQRPIREESYVMIFPVLSPEMNWRFRIYDHPGGGIRWEVNSDNR